MATRGLRRQPCTNDGGGGGCVADDGDGQGRCIRGCGSQGGCTVVSGKARCTGGGRSDAQSTTTCRCPSSLLLARQSSPQWHSWVLRGPTHPPGPLPRWGRVMFFTRPSLQGQGQVEKSGSKGEGILAKPAPLPTLLVTSKSP